ncbi:MAG: diguanylate cyclase [Clostridiales bacterium]|nr:diguanylate cyclase [Clostridiales bacterium]
MKKKIAVFTTGWCTEILSQFLKGLMTALSEDEADIFLFLCYSTFADTPARRHGEMNIFELPDLRDFDGAIVFGSGLDFRDRVDRIVEKCREANVPLILQGTRRPGMCSILSDNIQGTQELVRHLREKHDVRRIIFLAGTKDSFDSEQRLLAVREFLSENHCEEDLIDVYYTGWEIAAVTRFIDGLCAEKRPLPDAFICANDGLAMEACITLNKHGYDVPGDILVTGYDYIDDSKVFDPAIATVDQCFDTIGETAARLWKEYMSDAVNVRDEVIPCRFVPGESCGCFDFRDSDKIRRHMGREAYKKRGMTTYFNRRLDSIDSTIRSCLTYEDFKSDLHRFLLENHEHEGDSFHVLLEPNFSLSIYDNAVKLSTEGYGKYMEVLYSAEDGAVFTGERIESHDLIPGYRADGPNHLYIFLPLHEADCSYGYLVFRDCIDKIENRFLYTYENRMGLVFEKFHRALTLDITNKRLLNLMHRDVLTRVNNRVAYEDKENYLQAQIISDPDFRFAIAMFDVNNLKLINDSGGHEAGDEYLVRACRLICNVFKHSPVYRIGGDEFVAVLTGEDYENRDALMTRINDLMSPYSATLPLPADYVSIACGLSVFDPGRDNSASDVAKRADEAMYRDKTEKKKG